MEQDKRSPGPGMCGVDREVFERVWRRVMPEDRPDCPFRLYSDEERREMETLLETGGEAPQLPVPVPASVPAPVPAPVQAAEVSAPADQEKRPRRGEDQPDNDVPCLGAASLIYGELLQGFIARALSAWRTYQLLARRAPGHASATLGAMAADKRRHAKRLSAAYFLISGVRYWPDRMAGLPTGSTYPEGLRLRFAEEQRCRADYLAAAAETTDCCLRDLYLDLAAEDAAHASLLRTLTEMLP